MSKCKMSNVNIVLSVNRSTEIIRCLNFENNYIKEFFMKLFAHNQLDVDYPQMSPNNRKTNNMMVFIVMIQCILVCVGAASILTCAWKPGVSSWDFDKLARIMYLFDFEACSYKVETAKGLPDVKFSNDTMGFNVRPITWKKPAIDVASRLSSTTRKYIIISLSLHCIWFLLSIVHWLLIKNSKNPRLLKFSLALFFYYAVFMILFDVSMCLVYISHIKQSLSKGMVLRYSGWGSTLKLKSYDEFAGWLPIAASCCWIRGVIIFIINIYYCRSLNKIRKRLRRQQIKKKYENERYTVIPEPKHIVLKSNALVYRSGLSSPNRY